MRNKDFVEVYDESRKVGVRLYDTKSLWHRPDFAAGEWRMLWTGSWQQPPAQPPVIETPAPPTEAVQKLIANFGSPDEAVRSNPPEKSANGRVP